MKTPPSSAFGELDLLRRIRARSAAGRSPTVRLGIGDDCALLRVQPGEEVAVTTDLSLDGRHFRLDLHPPEAIGHRALARGLSDLAAMGARPLGAFLSLGLPRALTASATAGRARKSPRKLSSQPWIERFYDGLLALAEAHRVPLAGGDLSESPIALADIVLVGAVPAGRALLRSGARPGDNLYVTGTLGGSARGLDLLTQFKSGARLKNKPGLKRHDPALDAHLYPQPRLPQGAWLQRRGAATAAIDISDGLSTDLAHICDESGVAAEVDAELLPRALEASLDQALHGGEDYELLFTARPAIRLPRSIAGVRITCIGRILRARTRQPQMTLITTDGARPLTPRGWQHFA